MVQISLAEFVPILFTFTYSLLTIFIKGVDNMLEYDEYRIALTGLEQDINDLRDSL